MINTQAPGLHAERYKAVLADLDGVLVDAAELHYEALNRALKQICGLQIEREEHEQVFNALTTQQKLKILIDRGELEPCLSSKVWQLKQDLTMSVIKQRLEPDEIKIKMLRCLKNRGYLIGCVTNSITQTARLMLELTGQLQYLDVLVTNQDVKYPKPRAEPYIKALVKLGIEPAQALVIEDSDKGVQAAEAACIRCIRVVGPNEVTLERLLDVLE